MLGQVLPAHRSAYSQYGGLFQPSMTQAIRLLSSHPYNAASTYNDPEVQASRQREQIEQSLGQSPIVDLTDPFTNGSLFYTTNHVDRHHNPSMYNTRRHAWVHIFPEGKIHQHEDKIMRYFKWGVSRLILESEPAPTFVPVYIEGMDHVYHEGRGFPRPLPRPGKDLAVTFGKAIETDEGEFGEMRKKWRDLVEREAKSDAEVGKYLGVLTENLKYSEEAVKLREECTLRVRDEIIKLRKSRGLPDEDPKNSVVATWREEGATGQREGQMADGSWIKDT
jgi:monolysocardiolipin acyltransferase